MVALGDRASKAVGDKTAKALETLDVHTVGDLLRHYPRRYQERGRLAAFSELVVGEHATVYAEVVKVSGRRLRPKLYKTDVTIRDDDGRQMTMAIFNRPWADKDLRAGRRAFFAGKVETFNRKVQLGNPEYQLVDDEAGADLEEFAGAVIPVYPATAKCSSLVVQRSVRMALDLVDLGDDPLPAELRTGRGLVGLQDALTWVHRPADLGQVARAKARLTWDEAFTLQVTLAQRRAAARELPGVPRVPQPDGLLAAFDAQLPFTLTDGQEEIGRLLARELAEAHPMHRLLQGEVGSGKTLVALRAMLAVVDAGGQAALLAPTEVLAQQHFRSISELLGPLAQGQLLGGQHATEVVLLTGSQGAGERRTALQRAVSGEAGLVVGTHALLSEGVAFADLGLVVVDEQHRFGVEQREALRAKGAQPPHVLVMTATPIPRTVAMTVYGDLEVSTLTELPRGRSPVRTALVPVAEKPQWLETAWTRIREHVAEGRQAFVVCPRIGDDDAQVGEDGKRPAVAVLELAPLLADGALFGLRTQVLHGRMAPDDKDDVMRRFAAGEVDVLVATTVIEVGVDVPNVTVMVVMDADRFGVSQLHQLRGRVGRGAHGGLCLLVSEAELGSPSRERLEAVAATNDGFALSRVDLEQRREGDVLGASQSGKRSSLRLLRLLEHEDLIREARDAAVAVVDADPSLARHPALAQAVRDVLDEERAEYLEKA
ncbi:MAG: ATP-dependent DNA helicase RecG [Actinobacteria bacterium]|nr:ATP-dependent DNA helicase RecG [Actinomycetota bacterium]MCA1720376.1 ATP-dependent DNA helicase RecG [Actinomycetota bacterium]